MLQGTEIQEEENLISVLKSLTVQSETNRNKQKMLEPNPQNLGVAAE